MRPSLSRTAFSLLALATGLSACGNPDVERSNLVGILVERGEVTQDQAECVADRIFEDGRYTQDQLNEASRNPDQVEGFQADVDQAFDVCEIG